MTDKLIDFGHTFQIKSITCLMKNQTFLEQIHDILDDNYYDNDGLKWIVKECKKYFDEYRKCITLDVFKVNVNEIQNDVLKTSVVETLKDKLSTQIKNLDSWIMEFTRLDRFRGLNG